MRACFVHACICMQACMCACVFACIHACTYAYILCACILSCVSMCMQCACACAFVCVHAWDACMEVCENEWVCTCMCDCLTPRVSPSVRLWVHMNVCAGAGRIPVYLYACVCTKSYWLLRYIWVVCGKILCIFRWLHLLSCIAHFCVQKNVQKHRFCHHCVE